MLLEGRRDGRFSGGGEPGKPDREAALLAEIVTLRARERRVPRDVAVVGISLVVFLRCPWSPGRGVVPTLPLCRLEAVVLKLLKWPFLLFSQWFKNVTRHCTILHGFVQKVWGSDEEGGISAFRA